MQEFNKVNVLIIGSGGREHALLWAVSKSPIIGKLYIAGNIYGADKLAKVVVLDCNVSIDIVLFCKKNNIGLVVIGPERYLALGLVDDLLAEDIIVFGPGKIAAQLESSKSFTKDICKMNDIPTAKYAYFSDAKSAKGFVNNKECPLVIKDDGLAAGKGVVICQTVKEAYDAIDIMLGGKCGTESSTIVIEEFLVGTEVSYFAFFDGGSVVPFGTAQDYKSVMYEQKRYNTGGMGAFSPAKSKLSNVENLIIQRIIYPTVSALGSMGIKFRGVLFAGVMVTKNGPYLLEYNVRFGDPEIQSLVVRLKSDLLSLMLKTAKGSLHNESIHWNNKHSVCVVIANRGYPLEFKIGSVINGLEKLEKLDEVFVFHAGTKLEDNKLIAVGGRVLNIVACGETLEIARERAYSAVKLIDWPEGFYIENIGI